MLHRFVILMVIAIGLAGVARADDSLPVSTPPRSDPAPAKPWVVKTMPPYKMLQVMAEVSPIGWSFDDTRDRYNAFARLGPALWRVRQDGFAYVTASYEVSRNARSTIWLRGAASVRKFIGPTASIGIDLDGRLAAAAGVCFLATCLELEGRDRGGIRWTPMLTLTIPLRGITDEFTYLRRSE